MSQTIGSVNIAPDLTQQTQTGVPLGTPPGASANPAEGTGGFWSSTDFDSVAGFLLQAGMIVANAFSPGSQPTPPPNYAAYPAQPTPPAPKKNYDGLLFIGGGVLILVLVVLLLIRKRT